MGNTLHRTGSAPYHELSIGNGGHGVATRFPEPNIWSMDVSPARIVDTMIELARAVKSRQIIVTGSDSSEVLLELHRRGYLRVTTTKTCRFPCGQYDVALVTWREHSIKALEATLDWLVHFLSSAGVLVVWVGPHERMANGRLRLALDRLGFRIESATSCENGVAIAARRLESIPAAPRHRGRAR